MRTPLGFNAANTRQTEKAEATLLRRGADCSPCPGSTAASIASPNRNNARKASPMGYPACRLTHNSINGAVHATRLGRLLEASSSTRKMLPNRKENIWGRTPQAGAEAKAPQSVIKAAR